MPRLKITGKLIKFDLSKATETFREDLSTQLRQALRAFLRAAIPRIPVDTGMSRGSLLHLGRLTNVKVDIIPRTSREVFVGGKRYIIDNTELLKRKNKEVGAAQTTVNNRRSDNLTKATLFNLNKQSFTFTIKANILQMDIHEDRWKAFDTGREAFLDYLENVAPLRMTKLKDLIKLESV